MNYTLNQIQSLSFWQLEGLNKRLQEWEILHAKEHRRKEREERFRARALAAAQIFVGWFVFLVIVPLVGLSVGHAFGWSCPVSHHPMPTFHSYWWLLLEGFLWIIVGGLGGAVVVLLSHFFKQLWE